MTPDPHESPSSPSRSVPTGWPLDASLRLTTDFAFVQTPAMLEALFHHAPIGIMMADFGGRYLAINPAFQRLLGYTTEEFLTVGPDGITHPDDLAADKALFGEVLAGKIDHYRLEKRYVHKDGSVLWGALTMFQVGVGDRPFMVAMVEDITERKAAEAVLHQAHEVLERRIHERTAELERSEERFRLAARAANDALYDWDVDTGAIWWNEGTQQTFGYPPAEPASHGIDWWTDHIHPGDRDRIDCSLTAAIDGGAADWTDEYRFRRADGTYAPVLDRGYFVKNAEGRPVRMLGAMQDLTERLRMEELRAREQEARAEVAAARELDRMKTNFVSAISHELRTPLTGILGYAEFLEDEVAGPLSPDQATFVHEIEVGARRLEKLIDDLLDFARIDAGTFRLQRRPFDLQDKVREVLFALQPQARKAQVLLEPDLEADPLPVEADPQRVGQVLFNLIGNALKFTEPGGTIALRARRAGHVVLCEVADSGIGIAPEDLSKLFQRFSQLDAGFRRGGTGLGLSISKAIVDAHGGEIGVKSTPAQGSTFWFTLPLA